MASPPASDRPGSESTSLPSALRLSESASEGLSLARASEHLIQQFGGIRPMANKLEVPVTTVQGWKKRGAIPATRINDLRAAAIRHGIRLEEAELEAVSRSEDRHPEAARPHAHTRSSSSAPAPEPEAVPLPPTGPVPVNVPLAVPPVLPPERPAVPPFEVPVPAAAVPPAAVPPLAAHPIPAAARPNPPVSSPPPFTPPPAPAIPAAPARAPDAMPSLRPRPVAPQAATGRKTVPVASGAARLAMAAAAVALVAAAVAVLGSPSSSPNQTVSSSSSSVSERRLGDLEGKISRVALEQGAQTSAIEKQLGALDARIALAASQTTAGDLATRLAALEQDLPALQQRVAAQGVGTPALAEMLAATPLRNQLATAEPFSEELTAFRLTAFNDPPLKQALDQISSRARTGIPTQAWLIGRFSVVSGNIVRAADWRNPGQQAADLFLDLLSDWAPPLYRLTGIPQGSTPRAIADRAQAWMSAGDFARAVDQLGELTGKPAEAAVAWLGEARARVVADRARELMARHMQSISEPGAPTP